MPRRESQRSTSGLAVKHPGGALSLANSALRLVGSGRTGIAAGTLREPALACLVQLTPFRERDAC